MLSQRIQANLKPSPMFDFMSRAISNAYHPNTGPNGIISLGIAENTLMSQSLATFLSQNLRITPDIFSYSASSPGLTSLYDGLCKLYNGDTFSPAVKVDKDHLYVTAGCTTLLDQIFWTLCDKGDGVLIGRPCYGGFVPDMSVRSGCTPILVSLKGLDPFSKGAVVRYEEELLEAKKRGVRVRVLVLCTPHNPLGQYLTTFRVLT
jgi:1-aminocyclopropane-1-carboxylate synthase